MKLEKVFVSQKALEVLETNATTELNFLSKAIPVLVTDILMQSPETWKWYGCYWWNLQEVIRQHAPREYRDYIRYLGGEDAIGKDDEVKAIYDYGSDMNNWIAAQIYLEYRAELHQIHDPLHVFVSNDGRTRDYNPDIGFMSAHKDVDNIEEDSQA